MSLCVCVCPTEFPSVFQKSKGVFVFQIIFCFQAHFLRPINSNTKNFHPILESVRKSEGKHLATYAYTCGSTHISYRLSLKINRSCAADKPRIPTNPPPIQGTKYSPQPQGHRFSSEAALCLQKGRWELAELLMIFSWTTKNAMPCLKKIFWELVSKPISVESGITIGWIWSKPSSMGDIIYGIPSSWTMLVTRIVSAINPIVKQQQAIISLVTGEKKTQDIHLISP